MVAKSKTTEYQAWYRMRYGKHRICDRWAGSFENFLKDMGYKIMPGLTLHRVNSDIGYTPENCRWATMKQKSRNSPRNRNITYQGKIQCVAAWADVVGIRAETLRDRLNRGWSVERTLTETPRQTWKSKLQATEKRFQRWLLALKGTAAQLHGGQRGFYGGQRG